MVFVLFLFLFCFFGARAGLKLTPVFCYCFVFCLTGVLGFEPKLDDLESPVLTINTIHLFYFYGGG